jgi:hypothetical protein
MIKQSFIILLLILSISSNAQNQNLSNGNVFEGEPFIVINPTNTQNIVVAWMGFVAANGIRLSIKIKSSFNGGITWNNTLIMPHIVSTYKSADPSMAFDESGNLYLSYIDYREDPDSGGVYLFKSTDGGISWGNTVLMINAYDDGSEIPIDRPWLVINKSGLNQYLTTKPAPWIPAPNRPYIITSSDAGQTWQAWRYIDTTNYLVGNLIPGPMAAPVVSGNKILAAYPSYVASQNIYPQYILASSNNHGVSFTYSSIVSGNSIPNNDSAKLAYKLLSDPTDTNHIVFVYPYQPNGDIDILMTESFNAGLNWTAPTRVNDDAIGNGKMQDMVWADFDLNGNLAISWRDRRSGTGTGYSQPSDYYAAIREKDSINFHPNILLSDSLVPYNNILEKSGNDFMGLEYLNDTLYTVWGNTLDGSLDIWFSKIAANTGLIFSSVLIGSESEKISVFPNPTNGNFKIQTNDNSIIESINILNTKGVTILNQSVKSNSIIIDFYSYPAGIYFIQILSEGKIYSQKIIK